MDNEKRRRTRVNYNKRILCYEHISSLNGKKSHLKKPILIKLEDISYEGLRISCDQILNSGDTLIFNLGHNKELARIVAEVKWCHYSSEDCQAGLRILNISRELILFLNKIIRELSVKKTV